MEVVPQGVLERVRERAPDLIVLQRLEPAGRDREDGAGERGVLRVAPVALHGVLDDAQEPIAGRGDPAQRARAVSAHLAQHDGQRPLAEGGDRLIARHGGQLAELVREERGHAGGDLAVDTRQRRVRDPDRAPDVDHASHRLHERHERRQHVSDEHQPHAVRGEPLHVMVQNRQVQRFVAPFSRSGSPAVDTVCVSRRRGRARVAVATIRWVGQTR